jgi:hypothetical protein
LEKEVLDVIGCSEIERNCLSSRSHSWFHSIQVMWCLRGWHTNYQKINRRFFIDPPVDIDPSVDFDFVDRAQLPDLVFDLSGIHATLLFHQHRNICANIRQLGKSLDRNREFAYVMGSGSHILSLLRQERSMTRHERNK